ncbi:MAG TPA: DegT/DnrJ/EryC1/StrS family aminotransferase [Acidimicrobiia bacterium]|nr:DegT/DnrJ/EryC1/StrS family aminotransferase [Acidimicrobiia bacterium]
MAGPFPVAPAVGAAEEEAVLRVLRSGQIAAGPEVAAFEAEFASFVGTERAVAASSGTAALQMALVAAGVGPGDEVIVPALTFIASANAVVATGAAPVFVDLEACSFALDLRATEAAIGPRTKAVMVVHLYGIAADLGRLSELCSERGLMLVEDAAQAHGASFSGRAVGSWGIGAFSFYATKNMTTGEGGMVTTNNPGIAARARSFANHGRAEGHPTGYAHPSFGLNFRMTDIAAAIGRVQLARLPEANRARRALADLLLEVVPTDSRREVPPGVVPVWHLFPLIVDDRDRLAARLREEGVPTGVFYPAPLYRMARHLRQASCPIAESLCERLLCLRLGPYDETTRQRYAEAVTRAFAP